MSPAPGVPVCEGCGHIIRPYEQARVPEWHAECLNKQAPKTITVSCCAGCPFRGVEYPTLPERAQLICRIKGHAVPEARSRPVWCPLPITVKAEEG